MILGLLSSPAYYQVRLIIKFDRTELTVEADKSSTGEVRLSFSSFWNIFPHEAHPTMSPTWEAGEGEVEPANFQFQLSFDIAGSRGKLRVDQKTIVLNQLFLSLSLRIVSTYSVVWVFQLSLLQGRLMDKLFTLKLLSFSGRQVFSK